MTNDICPYINKCFEKKRQICIISYEYCTIYMKKKVLDPMQEYFIGSTKYNPSARHLEIIKGQKEDVKKRGETGIIKKIHDEI